MNISKTTHNYAAKRSLEVMVDIEAEATTVSIWEDDDDACEWLVAYETSETQEGLFFKNAVLLNGDLSAELPRWIKDEKQLRKVIDFIGKGNS